MARITERYASAVRSGNLKSRSETNFSDSDVLGAAGLAAKSHPVALELARVLSSDNHGADRLILLMAEMAWTRAQHERVKLRRVQAADLAKGVLAWMREHWAGARTGGLPVPRHSPQDPRAYRFWETVYFGMVAARFHGAGPIDWAKVDLDLWKERRGSLP